MAAGGDACAVRTPNAAVWALAPAAGSAKTPAKATHIAAVLIRIMTPTQTLSRSRNVSDCRANVNCKRNRVAKPYA